MSPPVPQRLVVFGLFKVKQSLLKKTRVTLAAQTQSSIKYVRLKMDNSAPSENCASEDILI